MNECMDRIGWMDVWMVCWLDGESKIGVWMDGWMERVG